MKLKSHSEKRLNYFSKTPPTHIIFENNLSVDTIITAKFELTTPTEFLYVYNPPLYNSLLVFPGDSICLDENGKVIFSTTIRNYIDEYIFIPDYGNAFAGFNIKSNPYRKGLTNLINQVDNIFVKNKMKIESSKLNEKEKGGLDLMNEYEKYFQIYNLVQIDNLNRSELMLMDSINNSIIGGKNFLSIRSGMMFSILGNIQKISAKKKLLPVHNMWTYFTKIDEKIKNNEYYQSYLYEEIIATFFYNFYGKKPPANKLSIQEIHNTLVQNKDNYPLKDSLIKFSDILLETKTNFASARKRILSFNNGIYAYLLADELTSNHENKNIHQIKNEQIEDVNNKRYTLNDILYDKKAKLIVIDFWASWCQPCIKEFPFVKKAEKELQNLPIKFITISIDDNDERENWVKESKKQFERIYSNHFRLIDGNKSKIAKMLQIKTIPRYIVLDNTGNVIDEDIERPSAGKFQMQLKKYLKAF